VARLFRSARLFGGLGAGDITLGPRTDMDNHHAWAKALRCTDILMQERHIQASEEPRLAIQNATRNVILCDAPIETFSQRMPTWVPPAPDDFDFLPIDVLYGTYDPYARSIEIYVNRIERDASLYGGTFEELLQIVRLHEYVHAVLHLGVRMHDSISTLRTYSPSGKTNWEDFTERRTRMFSALNSPSHEFLAQAVTYACLSNLPEYQASRLQAVFDKLETKQPRHYVVPADVKDEAFRVDWSLALQAARQELDVFRDDGFSIYEGLLALAREFTSNDEAMETTEREWVAGFPDSDAVRQLQRGLWVAERTEKSASEDLELLVDRFGALKIEVFAREHPPPHFRIKCGSESANYKISDCTQLNGGLRREYRAIREWHRENKGKIIAAWNEHRPADCPVGEYREA
jgi:Domain of unknown function (DUF4160)